MRKAVGNEPYIADKAKEDMILYVVEFIQFITSEGPFKAIHASIHPCQSLPFPQN